MINEEELIEKLAELEHEQWVHWTTYFLKQLPPLTVYDPMTINNIERWNRQIKTKYCDLSEKEKECDREWARKIIEILKESGLLK